MSTGLLPAGLLAETPPPRMNSMRARIHTMDSILESPGDQDDFFLPRSADDLDVDSEVAALTPGSGRRSARPTPSSGSLMMDKDAPALNEGALRDWTELDPDWTVIRNLDTGDRHVCKAENIMSVIGSKVDRTVSPSELKKQDGGLMNMDSLQGEMRRSSFTDAALSPHNRSRPSLSSPLSLHNLPFSSPPALFFFPSPLASPSSGQLKT